jgi:hypothetical protein
MMKQGKRIENESERVTTKVVIRHMTRLIEEMNERSKRKNPNQRNDDNEEMTAIVPAPIQKALSL